MGALEKVLQVFTLNGRGILQADYTGTCPIADSFPQQTDYSDLDSSSVLLTYSESKSDTYTPTQREVEQFSPRQC